MDEQIILADFGASLGLALGVGLLAKYAGDLLKEWFARKKEQEIEIKLSTGEKHVFRISRNMSNSEVNSAVVKALTDVGVKK